MKNLKRKISLSLFLVCLTIPILPKPNDIAPGGFMLINQETGEAQMLKDLTKGNKVIINFWATYCVPCKKEIPEIQELVKGFPDVTVFFINIDESSEKGKVLDLTNEWQITHTVLLDKYQQAAKAYIPKLSVPASFVIGKDGIIKYESIGYTDKTISGLKKALENLK